MSLLHRRGPVRVSADLTPMIDVTFLLIIFFVLVSQIVEVENVDLSLPELEDPATVIPGEEQRVVLNLVPGPRGQVRYCKIGSQIYPQGAEGMELLSRDLAELMITSPAVRINFRADRQARFEGIQPVLKAVSQATHIASSTSRVVTARVNLVILEED